MNSWSKIQSIPTSEKRFEDRVKVLESTGAQDIETNGCELSELEDIGFSLGNSQMELDAVFRPGDFTPFSPTVFKNLARGDGSSYQKLIVLDKQEDKENSPPTNLMSERPTEPPMFLRSRFFGKRTEIVPETVYRTLFEENFSCACVYLCLQLIEMFHYIGIFFFFSQMCEREKQF